MIVAVIIASLVIIFLAQYAYKLKHQKFYQLLDQFPCYPTYPIIGNLHMLYGATENAVMRIKNLMKPYDRLLFWIGLTPVLLVKKHQDIVAICNRCSDRESHGFIEPWTTKGILTSRYEDWKISRKMLHPAFSQEMLTTYIDVFKKATSNLIGEFRKVADTGEIIDVFDAIKISNTDVILQSVLGVSAEGEAKKTLRFSQAIFEFLKDSNKRVFTLWLHPSFIYKIYLKITGKIKFLKTLHTFPEEILKRTMNDFHEKKDQFDEAHPPKSMINLLVRKRLEHNFTEIRMRNELLQVIVGGTEAITFFSGFLMVMLAIHQDVQQKLFEEIVQFLANDDTLTIDRLTDPNELKYLEQCIKETARAFSPVSVTFRYTNKECVLDDGKVVPTGLTIMIPLLFHNRDAELFANPLKWDPQHYSEESIAKRPKGSDLLFGCGPRNCIGYKYAFLLSKIRIINIIKEFHLSTNIKEITEDDVTVDLLLRSKIGFPVKFSSRRKTGVIDS
uniref:Cytochrome P450 4461H1 short isoform n=1 Tax=Maconellicoccus hirsutus TaxID=177089 RepID=A0AAT9UTX3_MACHI